MADEPTNIEKIEEAKETTPLIGANRKNKKKRVIVRPTCCHSFFLLIQTYSSFSLLFLLICQIPPLFFLKIGGLELALRVYISFFALILLLVEVEAPYFSNTSGFMDNWLTRGILHSFLGLINEEQAAVVIGSQQSFLKKHPGSEISELLALFDLFIQITSYMLVISGCIYVLMWMLCLRGVKRNCQAKHAEAIEKERVRREALTEEDLDV